MIRMAFAVTCGGVIGTLLRFALATWVSNQWPRHFYLATLAVNLLGCLVAGLLAGGATLAAGSVIAAPAGAQVAAPARAVYSPQPVPLPFDPKAMPGLSEKLLTSHHGNNYTSAVRRISAIGAQIAALDPATAPGFQLNGLKREELIATNSMILHELYFANLGASGAASTGLAAMIERDFGSMARWQAEFSGTGKALGGGSGWTVLQYQHRDKRLAIQWADDHTMALVGGTARNVTARVEGDFSRFPFGNDAGGRFDVGRKHHSRLFRKDGGGHFGAGAVGFELRGELRSIGFVSVGTKRGESSDSGDGEETCGVVHDENP